MKYLCLGYADEALFDSQPDDVRTTVANACYAQCEVFRATGKVVAEEGLARTTTAKSIRPRKGRPTVTDGPFIETKEQLGAFFIVEAADIDEAVRIASLHPGALMGEEYGFGIEVRPIQQWVK